MKTLTLTVDQYYQAYAFFISARQRQAEVRMFEALFVNIVGEGVLADAIYRSDTVGDKNEYDTILAGMGIMVDWKNKKVKEDKSSE